MYQKIRNRAAELVGSGAEAVQHVGGSTYRVISSRDNDVQYEVQSDVGVCSCFSGQQGAFCKHQAAVHIKFKVGFPNSPN